MKELKLSYYKIDACENNCLLYYEDDKDKLICDHCKKDFYKEAHGKKSTSIPKRSKNIFLL